MKARFWPDWDEHILTSDRYQNDDGKIYFKEPGDSIFRSEDWLDIDYRLETKSLVNIVFLICFVKSAWFFLSPIIHIIIRTIKCFLLWLLTLPSLIFCNNHTFIPRMKQQRRHFIVYMTISLSLSLWKSAWFFLSSIIHIIIRTIKFFFVAFNIVVTITMLFIFCKNHTFIPRMRQQRRHFIVYITISLSLQLSI